jgi:hypothetical protein
MVSAGAKVNQRQLGLCGRPLSRAMWVESQEYGVALVSGRNSSLAAQPESANCGPLEIKMPRQDRIRRDTHHCAFQVESSVV